MRAITFNHGVILDGLHLLRACGLYDSFPSAEHLENVGNERSLYKVDTPTTFHTFSTMSAHPQHKIKVAILGATGTVGQR